MAPRQHPPRVLVLGDLMLDVVVAPQRRLEPGTDVPGRVLLRQGGSAATTARWLSRLGGRSTLVTAVGRDAVGRALVTALRHDRVTMRAVRVAGVRTGRIGVLVDTGGERSFVADRGAADAIHPHDLRTSWFRAVDVLHLPAYSLLSEPLGRAARRAIELARERAIAVSLDLASIGPLLAGGREAAATMVHEAHPDLLFATESEALALLGSGRPLEELLAFAPIAVVKRGPAGAAVLVDAVGVGRRFDVAGRRIHAADTTGAGDAFDAGVLLVWAATAPDDRHRSAVLRRATLAGQRAAARQLTAPKADLVLG